MNAAGDFSGGRIWTALRLVPAISTIIFSRSIKERVVLGDAGQWSVGELAASSLQVFAGWADIVISLCLPNEVGSTKHARFSLGFIPYRYVRLDLLFFH